MSKMEFKIYDLIRRHYLAQFFPRYEVDQTLIEVEVANEHFRTTGRVDVHPGWRQVLGKNIDDKEKPNPVLPHMEEGERAKVIAAKIEQKQTKPPGQYTEGTLVGAMKTVGTLVTDPAQKKILKDTQGIGTVATRAAIIKNLIDRNLLTVIGKKKLQSTATARSLIDALPDAVKDPALSAIWEQHLEAVADNTLELAAFMRAQTEWITDLINDVKKRAVTLRGSMPVDQNAPRCPKCTKPLRRRKSGKQTFWGCSGYPDCRYSLPDVKGKPVNRRRKLAIKQETSQDCIDCGKPMLRRNGRHGPFLGCSGYPVCRQTMPVPGMGTEKQKKAQRSKQLCR